MNPVLKKLSDPHLSRNQVADILEKHIGDGSNDYHCEQACNALRRIRDADTSAVVRTIAALLDRDGKHCETINVIIANLRSGSDEQRDRRRRLRRCCARKSMRGR